VSDNVEQRFEIDIHTYIVYKTTGVLLISRYGLSTEHRAGSHGAIRCWLFVR